MKVQKAPKTAVSRYYYTQDKRFEQSVDVYKPVDAAPADGKPRPLVVLVVGSAWLGHRPIIYAGTSWWNSSGPETVARLGCACVCIRHRGAFPVVPEPHLVLGFLVPLISITYWCWDLITAIVAVGVFIGLLCLWMWGARGSAKYEDMQQDVADALTWVYDNRDKHLTLAPKMPSSSEPFVFGGYSSGGHVAAMVLQNPELLKSRGLPPPEKLCDVVLMISAVLAVRPTMEKDSEEVHPRWLTDIVINTVFGKTGAKKLPSPLHGDLPELPHVLVGCEKEVFGLNWLDLFFSSRQYAEKLQRKKVEARYVEVKSDHWFVLSSRALSEALRFELQWIQKMPRTASSPCAVCSKRYCTEGHAVPKPNAIRQS